MRYKIVDLTTDEEREGEWATEEEAVAHAESLHYATPWGILQIGIEEFAAIVYLHEVWRPS